MKLDVVTRLRDACTDYNGAMIVRDANPREDVHCSLLYDAVDRIETLEALVDEMAKVLGAITEAYETDNLHKLLYRVSITK